MGYKSGKIEKRRAIFISEKLVSNNPHCCKTIIFYSNILSTYSFPNVLVPLKRV
jgi:hypothetical protein